MDNNIYEYRGFTLRYTEGSGEWMEMPNSLADAQNCLEQKDNKELIREFEMMIDWFIDESEYYYREHIIQNSIYGSE